MRCMPRQAVAAVLAWLCLASAASSFSTSSNSFNSPFSLLRSTAKSAGVSASSRLAWFSRPLRGGCAGDGNVFHPSGAATTRNSMKRWSLPTAVTTGGSSSSDVVDVTEYVSSDNLALLSARGRAAVERLITYDLIGGGKGAQRHVYAEWPGVGIDDEGKIKLAEQLADLDASYPGGLPMYLSKAQRLLRESAEGVNPFSDFEARVPEGETLHYGEEAFDQAEATGMEAVNGLVFVLVAGGLGERLGYSGIKLSLETNLCDESCYLELYCKYIQALQDRVNATVAIEDHGHHILIPLVIMTSGDTDAPTRELLRENDNFGLERNQVIIVTQDKVAALKDGNAGLALSEKDRWRVLTKPHGHGDVHHLLLREGLIEQWEKNGKTHVIFLQDTNALVINSVLPTLGVSIQRGFIMNSICIPRLAGEEAGAIAKLEHKTDPEKSLVINVEYNQLDPLLRTQGDKKGDVPDPATGYSPFPGNANNIVIELSAYAKTLRGEDQGVVIEFVNPKYKDASRTEFKKPTRLECMMQDIPKLFQKELGSSVAATKIGFCMFDRWYTFSPAKNALDAGQAAVAKGSTAPGTMSSAESDKYIQNQRKLKFAGVDLPVTHTPDDLIPMAGIPVTPGPRIVLLPSFGITRKDLQHKIQGPCRITQRSALILEGPHLNIKNLNLDGSLVIRAVKDAHVTVDGLSVQNKGWELHELDPAKEYPEDVRIRGYVMTKHETAVFLIEEPGNYVIDASGSVKQV